MKKTLLLLALLVLAVGCAQPRYQIVGVGESYAYRLDTRTGEILYIIGNASIPVVPAEIEKEKP